MKDRPTALDSYQGIMRTEKDCYATPEDRFVIEDETGRAFLKNLDSDELVTGLIVGLRCWELESGDLHVLQVVNPGMGPQQPFSAPKATGQLVAFVCGKLRGLRGQLLIDFLSGSLGAPRIQSQAARVVRLVVCGNSVGMQGIESIKHHHQHLSADEQHSLLEPLQTADTLLAQLASSMHVDVMPGADDPANHLQPQQPFNVTLFPYSSRYNTFHAVPNPYQFSIGSCEFFGTSGQNVDNLARFGAMGKNVGASRLDFVCQSLRWRHVCPTAPDTLPTYPFDRDPFILHATPHVYFVGNQPSFATRLIEGPDGQRVRVILLPSFAETGCVALLDLATLNVSTITISIEGKGKSE